MADSLHGTADRLGVHTPIMLSQQLSVPDRSGASRAGGWTIEQVDRSGCTVRELDRTSLRFGIRSNYAVMAFGEVLFEDLDAGQTGSSVEIVSLLLTFSSGLRGAQLT